MDLWSKELIDVSRSEGRERDYVQWQALRVLMHWVAGDHAVLVEVGSHAEILHLYCEL